MSMPTLNDIKRQVMLLSEADRKALNAFLLAQAEANAGNGKQIETRDFSREMEWIKQHRNAYRGQFVALWGEQLMAHGAREREVWPSSADAGVSDPFLAYIETEAEESFGGW